MSFTGAIARRPRMAFLPPCATGNAASAARPCGLPCKTFGTPRRRCATVGASTALAVRHLTPIVAFLAATVWAGAAVPAPAQSAAGEPVFTISGRGWGHGVGMSQWGAYGMARRGSGVRDIVSHYYPGTTLGRAPVARVRVLLAEGRKT